MTLPPSLGEVWPNAGSSEAVRSESCGKLSDSVQLLRTRLLPNVAATLRCTRGHSLVRVDRGLDPPPPLRALRALRSGSGPRPMRNLGDVCGGGALRALRLALFGRWRCWQARTGQQACEALQLCMCRFLFFSIAVDPSG